MELAGVSMSEAQNIVGRQGKFEIRIVTTGNETEHVLFGDTITGVGNPSQEPPGSGKWGVAFNLNDAGALAFQQAAINYGATTDPNNHNVQMLLDNQTVYSAPLSPELAGNLQSQQVKSLFASTEPVAAASMPRITSRST